jgi:hypothetical protein
MISTMEHQQFKYISVFSLKFILLLVSIIIAFFIVYIPYSSAELTATANNDLIPNGTVNTMVLGSDAVLYFGGNFDQVGPNVGTAIPINASTGVAQPTFSKFNGPVKAIIPDGSGGWYVGGNFSSVAGITRNNLVRISSNYEVDASWNPNVSGQVNTLVYDGTTLYVGGEFSSVGGTSRWRLAAIGSDGLPTSWNPNGTSTPSMTVYSMAISGGITYIGGTFGQVGTTTRNNIAAVNNSTGLLTSWNPNVGNAGSMMGSCYIWDDPLSVNTIAISGSDIYFGGKFSSVGGTERCSGASVSTSGTLSTSWAPQFNGQVMTMAITGSTVYVGGTFTEIDSTSRTGIASIGTDGTLSSWNPGATTAGVVNALLVNNSTLYVGGEFTQISGVTRNRLAAYSTVDNSITAWNPNAGDIVYAIAASDSTVYAGGLIYTLGGTTRNRLAAFNPDRTLNDWNPNANDVVYALKRDGSTLYVGGSFTTIGEYHRYAQFLES